MGRLQYKLTSVQIPKHSLKEDTQMAKATNETIVVHNEPTGGRLKHSEISLYNVVTKRQGKVFVRRQRKVNPHTLLLEI